MLVGIIGGTGTAGSYAVDALHESGHATRLISRASGVDVYTGTGLHDAFAQVDVVIDAVNIRSMRRVVAEDFFVTAASRVQAAAEAQGVQHLVVLSILGLDRVRGYGYYDAKLAQERVIGEGPVPTTILRASQFHEFPAQILSRTRFGPFAVVPHMRSQPVAARTVGRHLAQLAERRPGGTVELAGPQIHDVADLARRLARARGDRLAVLAVTPPGKAAKDMRGDALLATSGTTLDGPGYDEWVRSPDAARVPITSSTRSPRRAPAQRSG